LLGLNCNYRRLPQYRYLLSVPGTLPRNRQYQVSYQVAGVPDTRYS